MLPPCFNIDSAKQRINFVLLVAVLVLSLRHTLETDGCGVDIDGEGIVEGFSVLLQEGKEQSATLGVLEGRAYRNNQNPVVRVRLRSDGQPSWFHSADVLIVRLPLLFMVLEPIARLRRREALER
jgi:hypothetical protein